MKKFLWWWLFFFLICSSYANQDLIIKYRPSIAQHNMLSSGQMTQMQVAKRLMTPLDIASVARLEAFSGYKIKEVNQVGNGAHVIELQNSDLSESTIQRIIQKIKSSDSTIDYIEPNRVMKLMNLPSYNPQQWDMIEAVNGDNFENMQTMWQGLFPSQLPGNGVIIAVIDTGYTPHPNFLSNLESYNVSACTTQSGAGTQCYGYNFCKNSSVVDCGNASTYQPDALDWGDYTVDRDSSWHGSHVTGTIVANGYTTSGQSILGGAYGAKVMPLRTLGKGGGNTYDVANAVLYAVNQ
ncbi:MAG: S8 family serine peptidase, partial [Burkholderiales bacterium]|nr:S8 family serine peptidase [Burkholderiales bacterium]